MKRQDMNYYHETLDRSTGDLVSVSLGDFITVTELGEQYGKGRNEIRTILHHMGLLRSEGLHGRYRLAPFAVEAGLGKRIEKSRSGHPFDVISPKGQRMIGAAWNDVVVDLELEWLADPMISEARTALSDFSSSRNRQLKPQQQVTWVSFYYPDLTNRQIAAILAVSEQLVGRYVNRAAKRREFLERQIKRPLPVVTERDPTKPFGISEFLLAE